MNYYPFDLSAWCSHDAAEAHIKPPFGLQNVRGLPFHIGPRVIIPATPVEIRLGQSARWLLVAHRLAQTENFPVGRRIATYSFTYADGEQVEAAIRERLEISVVPVAWGQKALLAVSDEYDNLMPRNAGRWDETGFRQTEARQGWPQRFVLWAWRNPHPDREIAAWRIAPGEGQLIVAGLCLSQLEEDPFGRDPRRPVKIMLTDPEEAQQPFALSVAVDRGTATYPYPLPPQHTTPDTFDGWGQPYASQNSPAYVEIAALPSATVHIRQGDAEIAAVNWGEVLAQGASGTTKAHIELIERGKNWVHVTVLDDETGRPVPCRVHFRSPEGIPYQPHGHHDHLLSDAGTWHIDVGGDVRLGHVTYAYINGQCQGWLPRGEVIVDIARGFEYEPLHTHVRIAPGQRDLTLRIKRRLNMNAQRWFSGDSHVHFLSTIGAQFEAQGEDLNVVNLLQSQWGHLFTNTEDWLGRPVTTPDGQTIVYTSQENRQHMLGHLTLLGLTQPVMPWCSDGPDEAELGGTLEETLSHWADACHAQGGTVIIPHLPTPNLEPAALIATGRADAVEMLEHDMYRHMEYYRYLNGGYRLPLVGGTDKMSSDVALGMYRTYVYIPPDEPFTYENWCKNLRLGRTFLSGGPMIHLTVEGLTIGDTLMLPGGGTVEVHADAESVLPIHTLQIIQEGRVIAETSEAAGARQLSLRAKAEVRHPGWLAARVSGPGYAQPLRHHDAWRRGVMAHTSPIYVAVGEPWRMYSDETAQYMLTLLHGGLEYIRQRAPLHRPGTVTHHHDEDDHQAYLERPFHEAIAAVHKRMHEAGIPH